MQREAKAPYKVARDLRTQIQLVQEKLYADSRPDSNRCRSGAQRTLGDQRNSKKNITRKTECCILSRCTEEENRYP